DKLKTKQILELAYPLKVTFHRAIDRSKDILKSIDDLIDVGVDRVLTSAGKDKAYDDLKMMEQIVKRANNKIKIMAGSGISEENILSILNTGVDD
ncbi:copper homeostasis protein CutC, partial [Glaesserella parasuis]|uniref:copper homeostasis protein CutC n=2 Tax=Bacteria TaxID=2 RepID=UPI003F3BD898